MIRDLNERVPADEIKLNVIEKTSANIKVYLEDTSKPLEKLLTDLKNADLYYFTFQSKDIKYRENGKISKITMIVTKKM